MRKLALILNSLVVIFFLVFLAYTIVARQHIAELAREFVTEKTLEHSSKLVDIAEQSLDSPLVQKLVKPAQTQVIRHEIADYRQDPAAYVTDLTRQHTDAPVVDKANPLLAKVAGIKDKIRVYYNETLSALITDLRIFSLSNLVAGLIALGLAFRSSTEIRKSIVYFSLMMFAAVLYSSFIYVDDLTFFRILFRTHLGWGYAVLLSLLVVGLYIDFGRHAIVTKTNDEGQPQK